MTWRFITDGCFSLQKKESSAGYNWEGEGRSLGDSIKSVPTWVGRGWGGAGGCEEEEELARREDLGEFVWELWLPQCECGDPPVVWQPARSPPVSPLVGWCPLRPLLVRGCQLSVELQQFQSKLQASSLSPLTSSVSSTSISTVPASPPQGPPWLVGWYDVVWCGVMWRLVVRRLR